MTHRFLTPVPVSGSKPVCYSIPDPHGEAERAAAKCARARFRDRRAVRFYCLELYRYARGSDPIPAGIADDVAAVRMGMERDEVRRAEIVARARAMRPVAGVGGAD